VYVTLRHYRTSDADRVRALVVDEVLPNLRESEGLVAYYLLATGPGTLASLTLARDEAAARRSNEESAQWLAELFAGLVDRPQVIAGEVLVEKRFDPPATGTEESG
jgi:hypothetical protein